MIFNYAINNPSGYDAYPPVAMPTIAQSGAEILVADYQSEGKEGSPGRVTIVLRRIGGAWKITHQHTSVPFRMDGSFKAAVDLTP